MNFDSFGFKQNINNRIRELEFTRPTPIQSQVIPLLQKGRNVIGQAPTGTGKTHAFLLPLINNLVPTEANKAQLVIFSPTQELAQQIYENVKFLLKETEFSAQLYSKNKQPNFTKSQTPTIIIGTPERLRYAYESQKISITSATTIVVDEVDMIFTSGFIESLDFLLSKMARVSQFAFFSATINQELKNYLKKYIKNSFWVYVAPPLQSLTQHYYLDLGSQSPISVLLGLIKNLNPYLALIFVNHKKEIPLVEVALKKINLDSVATIHGDLTPRMRAQLMKRVYKGDFKYLIVSDVVARGLDLPGVSHVISLGLPKNLNFYWHRSGRTGRNQNTGESYLLATQQDLPSLEKLEKQGIKFTRLKLTKDNYLVRQTSVKAMKKKWTKSDNPEIKKLIGTFKNSKIKPNYRKKQKAAIQKLSKQQKRREVIATMRHNKKTKYKKRRSLLFD